jgi:hypothetical protein
MPTPQWEAHRAEVARGKQAAGPGPIRVLGSRPIRETAPIQKKPVNEFRFQGQRALLTYSQIGDLGDEALEEAITRWQTTATFKVRHQYSP